MYKDPKSVTLIKVISLVLNKSTTQSNTNNISALIVRNSVVPNLRVRVTNGKHYTYYNRNYYTKSKYYLKHPYLKAEFDRKRTIRSTKVVAATLLKKKGNILVQALTATTTATEIAKELLPL